MILKARLFPLILGFCLLHLSVSFTNPCKKGLRSVQFLPHPESNSKYIQCSLFGQMFTFTCPDGLVWSQTDLTCVLGKRDKSTAVSQEENAGVVVSPPPPPMVTINTSRVNSGGNGCNRISLTGSSFSLVNGLYGKMNENMYRRVDNLGLPGLIVAITDTKWCITYSFTASNFDTLTRDDVIRTCSSQLECCMLVSEMPSGRSLEDPERVWVVNMLDNKNKEDSNIEISCDTSGKICHRVPFCPPECLTQRDGCDVCECNGKPFFDTQMQLKSPQTEQRQKQTPVHNQQQSNEFQHQIQQQQQSATEPVDVQQKLQVQLNQQPFRFQQGPLGRFNLQETIQP